MKMLLDSKTAVVDEEMFAALPEYSCSLPTGKTVGKRWKRARNTRNGDDGWRLGEYQADPDPGYIRIKWRNLEVV